MSTSIKKSSDATQELSKFLVNTTFDQLPDEVVDRAKLIILDTIGVSLRGSQEPEMQNYYKQLPTNGHSTLLTKGLPKTNTNVAGFANATSACFMELDEGTRPTGHPALHVFPTALALAQHMGIGGKELINAFVLGYEVQYRLQIGARLRKAIHPHGNFGHIGDVVAIGKLLSWNTEQMQQGMNAAAGLVIGTSFTPCLTGSTIRNTYPGFSAQTTLTIKDLIESGFTGFDGAIEEAFSTILGNNFDESVLTKGLGNSYGVSKNYFKFHATCGMINPVLDALCDALHFGIDMNQYPPFRKGKLPNPNEITSVKVAVPKHALRLETPARNLKLSAKFSIPFNVASFIVRGKSDDNSFEQEILDNKTIRNLETKVQVVENEDFTKRWPEESNASVIIKFDNGDTQVGQCVNPLGSDNEQSLDEAVKAKFIALTETTLTKEEQQKVKNTLLNLEHEENVQRIFEALD